MIDINRHLFLSYWQFKLKQKRKNESKGSLCWLWSSYLSL